jgi:hypothetical protein
MPERNNQSLWYKDAIIYELHVKAFHDSNGDGMGDFRGLMRRLDYLQELGVTAVWLLPFYPSPLKDDGYDISDYRGVHADYGTLRDFRAFVREAHARGLRVITELVINHTSDQHRWFQAARRARRGTARHDYYVWSDTDTKFPETRIIFTDTESSNWAWDPVAGAYYWHRFFSHQPDLNLNDPRVVRAVGQVLRFWLDMGVDGLRLDAVPYLCVREGTNNENLPETHAVIKQLRGIVDEHYEDRMLLAEANQWPEDVRPYFGDGDECHMAFHFPLMPRIFMALRQEDRRPITDILNNTPDIPDVCQWALFLRNHDELTLEMVTDEERDYMYGEHVRRVRAGSADAREHRDSPPSGPARGQRAAANRDVEQPALLIAWHSRGLLRRRDRHGRQHLPGRSQRGPHTDAVDLGPQRRLLAGRSGASVSPGDHGSRLWLPGDQRGVATEEPILVVALHETPDQPAAAAQGFRSGIDGVPPPAQPQDPGLSPSLAWRGHPLRGQPVALRAALRAGPVGVQRMDAGGDDWQNRATPHR